MSCVRFNATGHYLGIAAEKLTLYKTDKKMPLLHTLEAHDEALTGFAFGADAKYLAAVSMDRHLTIYGPK